MHRANVEPNYGVPGRNPDRRRHSRIWPFRMVNASTIFWQSSVVGGSTPLFAHTVEPVQSMSASAWPTQNRF